MLNPQVEAAADASSAIKLDPCFAKGYLHAAKVQLARGNGAEARATLQAGLRTTLQTDCPLPTCLSWRTRWWRWRRLTPPPRVSRSASREVRRRARLQSAKATARGRGGA